MTTPAPAAVPGKTLGIVALIVAFLAAPIGAILGFVGYRKIRKVRPPERAIAQAQETKETLLHRG